MKKKTLKLIRSITYTLGIIVGTSLTGGIIGTLTILIIEWYKWIINYFL